MKLGWLGTSTAALIMSFAAALNANAAVCTITESINPHAYVSDATACGLGLAGDLVAKRSEVNNLGTPPGTGWSLIEQVNEGDGTYLDFTVGKEGSWTIDTTDLVQNEFLLILKSGNSAGENQTRWVWFLLDTEASAVNCPAGIELCGDYGLWGNGFIRRNLSHMRLFGRIGDQVAPLPAPGTLVLVAAGVLGFAFSRRRG